MNYFSTNLLQLINVAIVAFLSIVTMPLIDATIGFHTLLRVGDIDLLLSILLWGIIFFGYTAKVSTKQIQGHEIPFWKIHARQSISLYFLILILSPIAFPTLYQLATTTNPVLSLQTLLLTHITVVAIISVCIQTTYHLFIYSRGNENTSD
jgi:hypothetical protein